MSFFVLKKNKFFEYLETIRSEKLGIYTSFFLHFSILLFLIGLPDFFESKSINIPIIIPIEIINIEDTTLISKKISEKKIAQKEKVIIKEKKFSSSNNQEIKKITIKDSLEIENTIAEKNITLKNEFIIKEKKTIPLESEGKKIVINEKESEGKKIAINEKKIESLKIKKIKPKPKPLVDDLKLNEAVVPEAKSKPKPKPKPKPLADNLKPKKEPISEVKKEPISEVKKEPISEVKKEPISEVKSKQETQTDFNITSLLKDIRNDQINPKASDEEKSEEKKIQKIDKLKDKVSEENTTLSISEIDLVLQQLSRCFIAPLGSEIEKTTFVKISAKILQNRRVIQNSIRIVDTNIDISNPFYDPLTRSSMNTFLNPDCIPLKLPEEKYDLWKNITLTFDYSIMRGD